MSEIKIPSLRNITIRQYVAFKKATNDIDRFIAVTGYEKKKAMQFKLSAIEVTNEAFLAVVEAPLPEGKIYTMYRAGWFGRIAMIPDFTGMSVAEIADSETFLKSIDIDPQCIVKFMCVMYRPVTRRAGNYYTIAPYDSDVTASYQKYIEGMSVEVWLRVMFFFSNIKGKLRDASLQYLQTQLMKDRKELKRMMEEED
jgi:hypothetical protein